MMTRVLKVVSELRDGGKILAGNSSYGVSVYAKSVFLLTQPSWPTPFRCSFAATQKQKLLMISELEDYSYAFTWFMIHQFHGLVQRAEEGIENGRPTMKYGATEVLNYTGTDFD
ncbi:hypothetical protein CFP56_028049 [Quercus suber]|uniref:Uncharacterized protein n=1 Tax=Quercus suber TaxID=58331 RepID=A0AAW0JUJ0_QUESU